MSSTWTHPATIRALGLMQDIRNFRREVERLRNGDFWRVGHDPEAVQQIINNVENIERLLDRAVFPEGMT